MSHMSFIFPFPIASLVQVLLEQIELTKQFFSFGARGGHNLMCPTN
jgi:hypothetical protein